MAETMLRCQILLPPELRRRLVRLARSERRTVSDVTRTVIELGLNNLEVKTDEYWEKQKKVLLTLKKMRDEDPCVYAGDLVAETRAEREKEIERTWDQSS